MHKFNVFIIPSWSPSPRQPLSGTFFVEQAHAFAQHYSEWNVGICLFTIGDSYLPRNPKYLPTFCKDFFMRKRLAHHHAASGLHVYEAWKPWQALVRMKSIHEYEAIASVNAVQLALDDFICRCGKPDILHAHGGCQGGTVAARLARQLGIPFLITEHIGPFPCEYHTQGDGTWIPQLVEAYTQASHVFAVSKPLCEKIAQAGLSTGAEVLPNFVDEDAFYPVAGAAALNKRLRLLNIGWPTVDKGTDVLLQALSHISSDIRPHLSIVGDSAEKVGMQALCTQLGLDGDVTWLGAQARSEMPRIMQMHDCCILPSLHENLPVSLIEAIACGKPIISTYCGGPEDIVTPENGLLVQIKDSHALAEAIITMVHTIGNYSSATIREDFMQRFSSRAILQKLQNTYLRLVKNNDHRHSHHSINP